jgi:hypothetical protein
MGMIIWRGKSPFTVGEVDDDGNVTDSFTAQPGDVIPEKWMKIMREAEKIYDIDDKGKYDPKQVKEHFQKL